MEEVEIRPSVCFFTYCINIEKCVERAPNSGVCDITGWVTPEPFSGLPCMVVIIVP